LDLFVILEHTFSHNGGNSFFFAPMMIKQRIEKTFFKGQGWLLLQSAMLYHQTFYVNLYYFAAYELTIFEL
jgi:hypothetical protein